MHIVMMMAYLNSQDTDDDDDGIIYAGFVMLLQFRYQRAKLYRQVAMGKSHPLSVSQGISQCMHVVYYNYDVVI